MSALSLLVAVVSGVLLLFAVAVICVVVLALIGIVVVVALFDFGARWKPHAYM